MIREPLDLKWAVRTLLRHKLVLLVAALIGLVAGIAFAVLRPSVRTAQAWVVLPPSTRGGVQTQVLIAGSDAVLGGAVADLHPRVSLDSLRNRVHVGNRTNTILIVSATGDTAAQAEQTANAVAQQYVRYVRHRGNLPDGPVQARILQPAASTTGTKSSARYIGLALLGSAVGTVLAAFGTLAVRRRDRRLWDRDAIADSIGVPVLASIAVDHPSDAAGWRALLGGYEPRAVDAWRLRKALQYLGTDVGAAGTAPAGLRVTMLSADHDRGALAVGPQLAVFAASRGIPTALVVGPQEDVGTTATLRAACIASPHQFADTLQVLVTDEADANRLPDAALTVIVTVIDTDRSAAPELMPTDVTILAVSAGASTADQLARAAALAAAGRHEVVGIVVADPDPGDTSTGRLPQLERPTHRSRPTRVTTPVRETSR